MVSTEFLSQFSWLFNLLFDDSSKTTPDLTSSQFLLWKKIRNNLSFLKHQKIFDKTTERINEFHSGKERGEWNYLIIIFAIVFLDYRDFFSISLLFVDIREQFPDFVTISWLLEAVYTL